MLVRLTLFDLKGDGGLGWGGGNCLAQSFCSVCPQTVKRVMDRRTVDLYSMFNEELNLVKKEFNRRDPALPPSQPQYAGAATWARALKRRIDAPMKVRDCAVCTYQLSLVVQVVM